MFDRRAQIPHRALGRIDALTAGAAVEAVEAAARRNDQDRLGGAFDRERAVFRGHGAVCLNRQTRFEEHPLVINLVAVKHRACAAASEVAGVRQAPAGLVVEFWIPQLIAPLFDRLERSATHVAGDLAAQD